MSNSNRSTLEPKRCRDCLQVNSHCICDAYDALQGVYDVFGYPGAELPGNTPNADRLGAELSDAKAREDRAWARVKKLENRIRVIREALDGGFDG